MNQINFDPKTLDRISENLSELRESLTKAAISTSEAFENFAKAIEAMSPQMLSNFKNLVDEIERLEEIREKTEKDAQE